MKRIKLKPSTAQKVPLPPLRTPSVNAELIRERLGAEAFGRTPPAGSPMTLGALRGELLASVRSTGGRPGVEGAERRQKIPMSNDDWEKLERFSEELARDGLNVTAGQVASRLLHGAIAKLATGERSSYALPDEDFLRVSDRAVRSESERPSATREWLRKAENALRAARESLGEEEPE